MVKKQLKKMKDEILWPKYTINYAKQVRRMINQHTFILKESKIENNEIIFNDKKVHPNWKELYNQVVKNNVSSVFECGCGSGQHIKNISFLKPNIELGGCELLKSQLEFGKSYFKIGDNILNKVNVLDFSVKDIYKQINKKYDFVYTQAVVMHLMYDKAIRFIENMFNLSNKYVFLIERYYKIPNDHDYKDIINNMRKKLNMDINFSLTTKYINYGILLTKND